VLPAAEAKPAVAGETFGRTVTAKRCVASVFGFQPTCIRAAFLTCRVMVKGGKLLTFGFPVRPSTARTARSSPRSASAAFGSFNPVHNSARVRSESSVAFSGFPSHSAGTRQKPLVKYVSVTPISPSSHASACMSPSIQFVLCVWHSILMRSAVGCRSRIRRVASLTNHRLSLVRPTPRCATLNHTQQLRKTRLSMLWARSRPSLSPTRL
jgi:hypothetical protein